jgi:cytochrome c
MPSVNAAFTMNDRKILLAIHGTVPQDCMRRASRAAQWRVDMKAWTMAGTWLVMAGALAGTALADDGVAAGKAIFAQTCANCHSTSIGVNEIGPSLWHVVGRPVAKVPDYKYSDKLLSMSKDWSVWDETTLDSYLTNPRQILHGVRMSFRGLPEAKDRAAVIGYLATLQ